MQQVLVFILASSLLVSPLQAQCEVDPDNEEHWPHWPPIVTDQEGDLILPVGTDHHRMLSMAKDEVVLLSCGAGGQFEQEQSWGEGPLYARCLREQEFSVWVEGEDELTENFINLGCRAQPRDSNEIVNTCGAQGEGTEVNIGFDIRSQVGGVETVTITVCYDTARSINIWSRHSLGDEIDARDHGNDSPSFSPDQYFDFDVNHFYTMDQQKKTIAEIVRSQDLADQYVQDFDSDIYLARGHMAPNADFIFYSWMDATYHFINVSPQWQAFNGGNWMYFEGSVRDFVVERQMDIVVYTGTHGVCQLLDVDGVMVDIYLYDGDKLPVPRYYWKILYSPSLSAGVAVVGVNNPHLKSLPADYVICPAVENHPVLESLKHPEDLFRGYIWACRVEDLAAVVPNVPELPSMDLLM